MARHPVTSPSATRAPAEGMDSEKATRPKPKGRARNQLTVQAEITPAEKKAIKLLALTLDLTEGALVAAWIREMLAKHGQRKG